MGKTKYIKVSTTERKPIEGGVYFTADDGIKNTRLFDGRKRKFHGTTQPEFWFEPVTDREDEMREFIKKVQFDIQSGLYPQGENYDYEIDELLNELKQ